MVFGYEDKNDDATYAIYRFSWLLLLVLGLLGLGVFLTTSTELSFSAFDIIVKNITEITTVLLVLAGAGLLVGWLQVLITSKLGEEVILLITWIAPFLVIGTSLYLFNTNNDINYLGGTVAGGIFLLLVIYFRKSLRLSARLIEVGAEITAVNPSLFLPQLTAFLATVVVTVLLLPAIALATKVTLSIHPLLTIFAVALLMWMYAFVISAFQSFADASNIAFIDHWYSKKSSPTLTQAADQVKKQRAPIVRFAFLMAFISRFRSNQSRWNPFQLFELMKFSNWKNVLLRNRSLGSALARTAAYFGSYTLVVIIAEHSRSVVDAYKQSAKTVFKRFAENIAGSMGFNILESFRKFFSGILMLIAGGLYGWTQYNQDILVAIIFAFLFLILGFYPLNAMFKPVNNAYRLILYRSHTGRISSKLDPKTREIIRAVIK